MTIVNKNYDPVKSPFYAVEIKCFDNNEIDFNMVYSTADAEAREFLNQYNITTDEVLFTNNTNSTTVKPETTDLTLVYIGVPAAIVLLGTIIGVLCILR